MIVDANVLLYAVNTSAQHHETARNWLQSALTGPSRVGFPWQSTMAFIRVVTHPRIHATPLDVKAAWSFVADWLDAENSWIPSATARHRQVLQDLIVTGNITGNLVPDAVLAALAIEHGVPLCSYDSDFARFPDLTWINPADSRSLR